MRVEGFRLRARLSRRARRKHRCDVVIPLELRDIDHWVDSEISRKLQLVGVVVVNSNDAVGTDESGREFLGSLGVAKESDVLAGEENLVSY